MTLGEMLRAAMRAKSREIGHRYTFRELEADCAVNHAFASRVSRGKRHPSPETVKALSDALAPYLPLDDALIAAGHIPHGLPTGILQRIVRVIRESDLPQEAALEVEGAEVAAAEDEFLAQFGALLRRFRHPPNANAEQ